MTNAWRRRGVLLKPPTALRWVRTHAALPIVDDVTAGGFDVLFSARDECGRARIGRARLASHGAGFHAHVQEEPVLDLGELGTFDDRGVTGACMVRHGGRKYLYYSGWTLGVTVPFYFYVGCAVSDDGGRTFQRVSRGPILERDDIDPFLTASPWVEATDATWRMWYVSGTGWTGTAGDARHAYHIKYAESDDGIRWRRTGHVCIDYADAEEHAVSRPCVVRDGDRYRMWFASRGDAYRIHHAESVDGLTWQRSDGAAALEPGPVGSWDHEMVCYPHVFDFAGERLMLYNGNGYGATGIGWAQWTTA